MLRTDHTRFGDLTGLQTKIIPLRRLIMHPYTASGFIICQRVVIGLTRTDFRSIMRLLVSLAFVTVAAASCLEARANTITVTSTADSATNGDGTGCTLRKAIINANNNAATFSDCAAG